MRRLRAVGLALALLTASVGAGASTESAEYDGVFFFGDSLTDTGNACALAPSPPYAPGRCSNGPVWAELFAEALGAEALSSSVGGSNYAVGGARTDTTNNFFSASGGLWNQIESFTAGGAAPPEALYAVWAGGNDFLLTLVPDPVTAARQSAANVRGALDALLAAGARRFLVVTLPDLGLTPLVRMEGPERVAAAGLFSTTFNVELLRAVAELEAAWDLEIAVLDVMAIFAEIEADPEAFGFTNITDACVDLFASPVPCADPDVHVFWDFAHPTAAVHTLLGDAALAALPPRLAPARIDIRPYARFNRIRPRSRGLVRVALFGSDGLAVEGIDPGSLAFGPAGAPLACRRAIRFADLDGDGIQDLIARFRIAAAGIAVGDEQACLTGETRDGIRFEGCDAVRTVPRRPWRKLRAWR
ncbi:MAG: SGNH/GDSL hydrolase family protein [Myxococcota bacterium]|nr:SGNH/GDSL hydrolase family protein [Myxococcota bacterium]